MALLDRYMANQLARKGKKLDLEEVRRESERLYGKLVIQGGTLHYAFRGSQVWSIPADSIVLIGEHTNNRWTTDYFYVFIGGHPRGPYEAPMYSATGILEQLSPMLGSRLVPGLANSTDFKSRIIWPDDLADQPLYDYRPAPRSGLWGGLLDRIVPRVIARYTRAAQEYLESRVEQGGRPSQQ